MDPFDWRLAGIVPRQRLQYRAEIWLVEVCKGKALMGIEPNLVWSRLQTVVGYVLHHVALWFATWSVQPLLLCVTVDIDW